jgi:fluoride exporter
MSVLLALGVGLIGGLGAVARFGLDGAVSEWAGREFPYGTLVVNVVGAFLLGVLVGASAGPDASRLLGTGLIGAFTTFSTWAFESHRLGEDGQLRVGILNLGLSLALGLAAVWLGRTVGGWL